MTRPCYIQTTSACFLDSPPDLFDAALFGLGATEASAMDPQQRMLLETALQALAAAGVQRHELMGQRIGIYVCGSEPILHWYLCKIFTFMVRQYGGLPLEHTS